mgnify:CR=1 FL=1
MFRGMCMVGHYQDQILQEVHRLIVSVVKCEVKYEVKCEVKGELVHMKISIVSSYENKYMTNRSCNNNSTASVAINVGTNPYVVSHFF